MGPEIMPLTSSVYFSRNNASASLIVMFGLLCHLRQTRFNVGVTLFPCIATTHWIVPHWQLYSVVALPSRPDDLHEQESGVSG